MGKRASDRPAPRVVKFSKHFADTQRLSARAKAALREFDEVKKALEREIQNLAVPFKMGSKKLPEGYSMWATRAVIAMHLLDTLDEIEKSAEVPNQYNLLLHAQTRLRSYVLTDDYFLRTIEDIRHNYHSYCEGFVHAAAEACDIKLRSLTEEIRANGVKLGNAVDKANGIA